MEPFGVALKFHENFFKPTQQQRQQSIPVGCTPRGLLDTGYDYTFLLSFHDTRFYNLFYYKRNKSIKQIVYLITFTVKLHKPIIKYI